MDNVEDVYTLAPIQEGLVYHTIQAPGSGIFVDQVSCTLRGRLDVAALRQAWDHLVARHGALRSCFLWDGLDEPLQVVRGRVDLPWLEQDWRGLDPDDRATRLATLVADDRRRGFDIGLAPLMRMHLARTDESEWHWLWSFHHLISDGWSTAILLHEAFVAYRAIQQRHEPDLTPPFRYRDFVAWQTTREAGGAEVFWRQELHGVDAPGRLYLPAVGAPAEGGTHRQTEHRLEADLSAGLRGLAAACGVTLNTVVQAAWALLLSRYAHDDDVLFGVTLSGRPAEIPGIEHGVGLFINTLPLRLQLDPRMPLRAWLTQLQKKNFELLHWQATPLVDIQRWAEVPPGEPLFDNILVFENYPSSVGLDAGPDLDIGAPVIVEQSNYPFALLVVPEERLRFIAVHDDVRFPAHQVDRILCQLAILLRAFAAAPDQVLGQFALVEPGPAAAVEPALPAAPTVVQMILGGVASVPTEPAIQAADGVLDYRALEQDSGRIARALRARGIAANDRVGVYADRCLDMLLAVVGILRAGAAYVPLDRRYPADQIAFIAQDAGLAAILSPGRLVTTVPATAAPVIDVDALRAATPPEPDPPLPLPAADDLAYVIYTSGSTGRPKGVMVSHASLARSTRARLDYYGDAGRFLLLSSFAFDSSVAGIFWTLCSGGSLVLPEDGLEQDMARLTSLLAERGVTTLLCLPSLYALLLEAGPGDRLATLETAIIAGEACNPEVVQQHFRRIPEVALFNEYGPTEATVWSTVHRLTEADARGPVPIGRPVAGIDVQLLDQHRQPVPPGVCGELYLSGEALALGYQGNPELTAERFVELELPPRGRRRAYRTGDLGLCRDDGTLVFLGRSDDQVKIRGFRVELGAVEEAIAGHPEVAAAAVRLAAGENPGRPARLLAYLVAAPAGVRDAGLEGRILAHLGQRLPDYMLPGQLTVLDALPRLPNGKVDYRALPTRGSRADSDRALHGRQAQSDTEKTLATLWMDLLGLDAVGVHDDFFRLGGDSILSIQLISRARQAGLRIEPRDLLRHPTIAAMAQRARPSEAAPDGDDQAIGETPLTPVQAWFFELDLVAPQHWNQSALFELTGDTDADALTQALTLCWRHHDALRARFWRDADGWHQAIVSADALTPGFDWIDLSVLPAEQREVAMRRHIARVQAGFDLDRGGLLHAVWFYQGSDRPALLLIAAHHLVVDAVSWLILIEDIESAYRQHRDGGSVELPPKTTSLRAWSQRLARWSRSPGLDTEAGRWAAACDPTAGTPPPGRPGVDAGTEASARTLSAALDETETLFFLGAANAAYQTRADELLVAAVALAQRRLSGDRSLCLDLESHGRSDAFDGIDVSRTVGWFTAMYPVRLDIGACDGPEATIKSIKQQLRNQPQAGLRYGVARYLSDDPATRQRLRATASPGLLLNYLGRSQAPEGQRQLRRISGVEETSRDPRNARTHRLQINARVTRDRLALDLGYSTDCDQPATVERLAGAVISELRALLAHCALPTAGGHTPSDFPAVDLSQDELDRLLDGLE